MQTNPSYNNELFSKIKELMNSSKLSIDLIKSNGECLIYPVGSVFLDKELVIAPLKFLDGSSHSHFISGLKSYSNKNKDDYIKSAESMRRTLVRVSKVLYKTQVKL